MYLYPPIPLLAAQKKGPRDRTYPAGIYITPDTIYAIQFRVHAGILQIQHFGQIATPPASIAPNNGAVRDPQALTFALHALWRQVGFKTKKTVVSVWGSDLLVRQIDFPPMPENMLNETVLMSELERYPLFEGKNVVADAFVVKKSEQGLQTCVAATDKDVIDGLRMAIDQAGLTLIGTDIAQFSLLRTLVATGDISPTADWGCLEILPGKLAISLWNRTNLLSWREAEIDDLHHSILDAGNIEDLAQRIFLEVSRSLQVVGGFSPKRFLVTALNTADAQWLSERLESELGLNAYIAVAHRDLVGKTGPSADSFLIAAGGSLWLHEAFPSHLNFYKPKNFMLQLQRSLDRYVPAINIPQHDISPIFKVSLGLGIAGMVGIHFAKGYFKSEQEKLQTQIQEVQAQATLFQAKSQDAELLRLKDTVMMISKPMGWPIEAFLGTIREQIPHDTWLSSLSFEVGGSLKLDGAAIKINSPLLFAYNLGQLEDIQQVDLSKISRAKDGTHSFTLSLVLKSGTPAPAASPGAVPQPGQPGTVPQPAQPGAVPPPVPPPAGMPTDSGPPGGPR